MEKNPPTNARDLRDTGSRPGSGTCPGEGNGNPLQYSCQETPIDREAWLATVHGVTKSRRPLSTYCAMEISPGTEEMTERKRDPQPIDRYSQHSSFC